MFDLLIRLLVSMFGGDKTTYRVRIEDHSFKNKIKAIKKNDL